MITEDFEYKPDYDDTADDDRGWSWSDDMYDCGCCTCCGCDCDG